MSIIINIKIVRKKINWKLSPPNGVVNEKRKNLQYLVDFLFIELCSVVNNFHVQIYHQLANDHQQQRQQQHQHQQQQQQYLLFLNNSGPFAFRCRTSCTHGLTRQSRLGQAKIHRRWIEWLMPMHFFSIPLSAGTSSSSYHPFKRPIHFGQSLLLIRYSADKNKIKWMKMMDNNNYGLGKGYLLLI